MGKRRSRDIPGDAHFLTFTCMAHEQLFEDVGLADLFLRHLVEAKQACNFKIWSYVVMPEHVHVLDWSENLVVAKVLQAIKTRFAYQVVQEWKATDDARLIRCSTNLGESRFWLAGGGYDKTVSGRESAYQVIHYIHENPVRRGLVETAVEWPWSSARAYYDDFDDSLTDVYK